MVLGASLLNTQQYKVRIKGKVEQSRERPPLQLGVVAIEKGAFWSPSTTVANLLTTLLEKRMKSYQFVPFKIINGIPNYGRHFFYISPRTVNVK